MIRISTLIIILLYTLSLLPYSAIGQNEWSLQQCIEYALDNNIQLKQQELNVRVNENQLTRAKLSVYPNLNASANHNYSFGRTTNFITNQKERRDLQSTSASISTQLTLFNGFQITNSQRQEALNLMASISDVEKLKNSIALNISAAYLQILFTQEILETNIRQQELTQLQVNRTKQLVRAGSLAEGNLLEIEAQLATDELQVVNSQNQLNLAYLTLTQILDIKNPEGFSILRPDLKSFEENVFTDSPTNVFDQAQQILPQIKGATLRVQSAEKGVQIAKGALYPRLSLVANYGTGSQRLLRSDPLYSPDPFLDQIRDNANYNVGLNLSIPIFNGWQVRTSISNAFINLDNARYNLELERNFLYKDIQQAYADALGALKKYKASEKNVEALKEAFRYAEQRFNLGLVNSLDYTTSKTRLNRAEADLLSAKYEFIFKTKILDFYRGNPLSL